ncbi:hypothetical protein PAE61_01085 (plasmid) [Paracoccus aerodenitrificans]|nr:hypothetical protein PAE61_01085 [Paracoccus aerodenitrificans]
MELVFLTLRPLGPISQIFDALFEKIAFALIGLNLGAKFLNFGLQHTGFRGVSGVSLGVAIRFTAPFLCPLASFHRSSSAASML